MLARYGCVVGCLLMGTAYAGAAPLQLYGKSVVVTWTENRVQTRRGSDVKEQVAISQSLSVYISSAGRLFSRREAVGRAIGGGRRRAGGRSVYGSNEHVGSQGVTSSGGSSSTRFQGQSLLFDAAFRSGARRVEADFDAGYASCTARVIHGRAGGSATTAYRTLTGVDIVVHSMEVSSPSCRIVDGNVFAGD